jgi:hypothetical protein
VSMQWAVGCVNKEGRTTFVEHVAESPTTEYDTPLGDEGKPVSARYSDPIVLTLTRSRRRHH